MSGALIPPPVSGLLDLSGQVALVTGASGGLGAAISARFAEAGATIVMHCHQNAARMRSSLASITAAGGHAIEVEGDLSQPADVDRVFDTVLTACSKIDILINNAGIYPMASALEMQLDEWDRVYAANVRASMLCSRRFAQINVEAARSGSIVMVSSIEATNPAYGHSHYSSSKAAIIAYAKSLAGELGPRGIRVNTVSPGLLWREGIEQAWPAGVNAYQAAAALGRIGQPAEVADACLFLASPAARWVTGADLLVDGGVMTHRIY